MAIFSNFSVALPSVPLGRRHTLQHRQFSPSVLPQGQLHSRFRFMSLRTSDRGSAHSILKGRGLFSQAISLLGNLTLCCCSVWFPDSKKFPRGFFLLCPQLLVSGSVCRSTPALSGDTISVATMNEKFGIDGSVAVVTGNCGLPKVVLTHECGASAEVGTQLDYWILLYLLIPLTPCPTGTCASDILVRCLHYLVEAEVR